MTTYAPHRGHTCAGDAAHVRAAWPRRAPLNASRGRRARLSCPSRPTRRASQRPRALVFIGGVSALLLTCGPAGAQEGVTYSATVDRTEVPQNEVLVFTMTVRWRGAMEDCEFQWPATPQCTNLTVVGQATSNEVSSEQGERTATRSFSYTLRPLATGPATIGPTALTYVRRSEGSSAPRTLGTSPITVAVVRPAADARSRLPLWALAIVVVGAGGGLYAFLLARRRRATEPLAEEKPAESSAEDQALGELEEAGRLRVAGELKAYYGEIARILTTYLEAKWSVPCVAVATYDVVQRMRQQGELPDGIVERMESVLSECDLVKFSNYDPTPPQLDRVRDQAAGLIAELAELARPRRRSS